MQAGFPASMPLFRPCAALQEHVGEPVAGVEQEQPLLQMDLGLQVVKLLQSGGGAGGGTVPGYSTVRV